MSSTLLLTKHTTTKKNPSFSTKENLLFLGKQKRKTFNRKYDKHLIHWEKVDSFRKFTRDQKKKKKRDYKKI